jgi:hypothetical protein
MLAEPSQVVRPSQPSGTITCISANGHHEHECKDKCEHHYKARLLATKIPTMSGPGTRDLVISQPLPPNCKPRNAAGQCQLTLALLLRGFSVGLEIYLCTGLSTPGFSKTHTCVESRTPKQSASMSHHFKRTAVDKGRW